MAKQAKESGAEAFRAFYGAIYGDRWDGLSAALLGEGAGAEIGAERGLLEPYRLDAASVFAAESLPLPESGEILDACAAPGGKTLVLASRLAPGATLVANELSSERRRRLSDVLDGHLSPSLRARVRVSGFDAAEAGGRPSERGRFGAILLDAPCSSERHVLRDRAALDEWTAARVRFLARRQWSLLSSAFLMLAPGGSLVYSTCSICPDENDGVVGRLFDKYGAEAESIRPEAIAFPGAEITERGLLILPDRSGGAGPMYVAGIRKSINR